MRSLDRLGYAQEWILQLSKMSGKTVKLYELCMKDDNRVSPWIDGTWCAVCVQLDLYHISCQFLKWMSVSSFFIEYRALPSTSQNYWRCGAGQACHYQARPCAEEPWSAWCVCSDCWHAVWMTDTLFAALFSILLESKVCLSPQGSFSSSQLSRYYALVVLDYLSLMLPGRTRLVHVKLAGFWQQAIRISCQCTQSECSALDCILALPVFTDEAAQE